MIKIIPLGDRILVRRRKIGQKVGLIELPDQVKDRNTDLADVIFVPDLTFSDKEILDNAEEIIKTLTKKAINGNIEATKALLEMNTFIKLKSIKVDDKVFISKYVGTDFHGTGDAESQTLVRCDDILGIVIDE